MKEEDFPIQIDCECQVVDVVEALSEVIKEIGYRFEMYEGELDGYELVRLVKIEEGEE